MKKQKGLDLLLNSQYNDTNPWLGKMMKNKNWQHYIQQAYESLLCEHNTRELGKFLANANEHMQVDWINSNTSLSVSMRDDEDHNGTGYDLISESGLRIQSKFRGGKSLFIEQTRRISAKNTGAAATSGHVVPSLGECDVYVFTLPNDKYRDPTEAEILAIPEAALEDPKNPGFLVRSVRKNVQNKFRGRAKQVLESLESGGSCTASI